MLVYGVIEGSQDQDLHPNTLLPVKHSSIQHQILTINMINKKSLPYSCDLFFTHSPSDLKDKICSSCVIKMAKFSI